MGISSPLTEWDGCDTQTPPSFPVNSCTWPMPLCVKEWNIGSDCCPGFLSTCSGCPVAMTLIKHVCLSFLWNSCWRTGPFHGKRITPFYQRGQTDECASNLGCINKFFSCLSMLFLLPVFFLQMTKSVTNPEELGGLASQMTSDYGHLALQGRMAAATAEPEEVCSF